MKAAIQPLVNTQVEQAGCWAEAHLHPGCTCVGRHHRNEAKPIKGPIMSVLNMWNSFRRKGKFKVQDERQKEILERSGAPAEEAVSKFPAS